jgi:hypothetical protein
MSRRRWERRVLVSGICGMICLVAGPALGADRFDGAYITLVKGTDKRLGGSNVSRRR